jgi:hypothetical protein
MTNPSIEQPMLDLAQGLRIHADRWRHRTGALAAARMGDERPETVEAGEVAKVGHPVTSFEALVSSVNFGFPDASSVVRPPPSRFMLRVTPTGRPHRPTKRNYDYFDELTSRLAALEGENHKPPSA